MRIGVARVDRIQAQMLSEELQGQVVGGWLIDSFLGNGKSAVVMSATKEGVEGAIKVFHRELVERYGKEMQYERILRERSLVGAHHENLVKILDGGECPDTQFLYVVMEKLPHKNLHDRLHDIPLAAVPGIISQVASAARFLEDRQLAHRDIKPENIVISDDFSKAILLDLGVLLPIGASSLTDVDQRQFIGTLRYSSPEFLFREEESTIEGWRAVTFYQLGAVLHDLLMKKVLFEEFTDPFPRLVEAVKSERPHIVSTDYRCVQLANRCLTKLASTRLELVKWTDFHFDELAVSPAVVARERVLQRQQYQRQASGPQQPAALAVSQIKRMLEDACNQFGTRLAAFFNGAGLFPLRMTHTSSDPLTKKFQVCIQFERDEELGLFCNLSVLFDVELVDVNAGDPIYRAATSGVLALEPISDFTSAPDKSYAGDLPALLDGIFLELTLVGYLDAAYNALDQGIELKTNVAFPLISN